MKSNIPGLRDRSDEWSDDHRLAERRGAGYVTITNEEGVRREVPYSDEELSRILRESSKKLAQDQFRRP